MPPNRNKTKTKTNEMKPLKVKHWLWRYFTNCES